LDNIRLYRNFPLNSARLDGRLSRQLTGNHLGKRILPMRRCWLAGSNNEYWRSPPYIPQEFSRYVTFRCNGSRVGFLRYFPSNFQTPSSIVAAFSEENIQGIADNISGVAFFVCGNCSSVLFTNAFILPAS
jgi:hypothetical protein